MPPDDLEEWSGESFTPDQTNLRRSSECFRVIQQRSGRRAAVERPTCSLSKRPEAHSSPSPRKSAGTPSGHPFRQPCWAHLSPEAYRQRVADLVPLDGKKWRPQISVLRIGENLARIFLLTSSRSADPRLKRPFDRTGGRCRLPRKPSLFPSSLTRQALLWAGLGHFYGWLADQNKRF